VNGPTDQHRKDAQQRTDAQRTDEKPTLYIFPHAGGSTTFYVPFAKAFSGDIKRVAVQYPRRDNRPGLTELESIPALADDIYAMMAPSAQTDVPMAFFGHSMGGSLAFEVALRFQSAGYRVAALFVSSCAAPGNVRFKELQGSDQEILNLVAQVTDTKPELLAGDEFAASVLPTLQSVRAITGYTRPPEIKVSCPIYAFVGDNDVLVTQEDLAAWSERTTAEFALRVFSGDHFYLNNHLPELAEIVESNALRLSVIS
jgi:surfactin synthase thioesterase subunit